jgi:hypothetical protein
MFVFTFVGFAELFNKLGVDASVVLKMALSKCSFTPILQWPKASYFFIFSRTSQVTVLK